VSVRRCVVVLVAGLGLAGCSGGTHTVIGAAAPSSATSSAAPSSATAPSGTVATASEAANVSPSSDLSGRKYAYIEAVDPAKRTVTIDVVDYFTGEAAVNACEQDGLHSAGAPECRSYYVRNQNPALRTLPIAPKATIDVVGGSGGTTDGPGTLTQVASGIYGGLNLYRLDVDDSQITNLYGVFLG
jgi:hypothetical protein